MIAVVVQLYLYSLHQLYTAIVCVSCRRQHKYYVAIESYCDTYFIIKKEAGMLHLHCSYLYFYFYFYLSEVLKLLKLVGGEELLRPRRGPRAIVEIEIY